jgi:hypothetical protein
MLIRSQDKKNIMNLSNATMISAGKVYGADKSRWLIEIDRQSIGQYTTESKAIKALDMIARKYDEINMYCNQPEQGYIYSVFQMPSDEEVED